MQNSVTTFHLDKGPVHIQAIVPSGGEGAVMPIVYLLEPVKNIPALEGFVKEGRCALVSVFGMDWDRDLTPWKAPKAYKRGRDFEGGAEEFMGELVGDILPSVEGRIAEECQWGSIGERALVGISLGGLFSLYCSYFTDAFQMIGSVSGSLWYDGFTEWMKGRTPLARRFYFSLGDKERLTKIERMARVEDCTREAVSILEGKAQVFFELNPGNHFMDAVERLSKAISYLLGG